MNLLEKLGNISLGRIITRGNANYRINFVDDIENIELLLAHGIPEGLPYIFSSIIIYVSIFIADWRLGLISLIQIPIGIITMGLMIKSGKEKSNELQKSLSTLTNTILEYVMGMEVIKTFNKNESSFRKVENIVDSHEKFTIDWFRSNWNYMAVFQSVVPSTLLFVLPIGMYMVMNGVLEISVLLFISIMLLAVSTPLKKIMNLAPILYNVINRIDILEKEFNKGYLVVGTENVDIQNHNLAFNKVRFAYDDKEILHDISFDIEKGTRIGIVGESGSGKSTIAKLIMHYWDVNSGEITLGGIDIRKIPLTQLMDNISFVSQDNFLFNISIKENLLIGNKNATEGDIIEACKLARCHDFILNLENGYNTVAGDSGNKLSGGERQRITIARALLKNTPILVLDEMTSYTDAENDKKINEAIENISKGRTINTIAHRLHSIQNMDKILLIDNGKLLAEGKHETLLKNNKYKELWDRYLYSTEFKLQVSEVQNA